MEGGSVHYLLSPLFQTRCGLRLKKPSSRHGLIPSAPTTCGPLSSQPTMLAVRNESSNERRIPDRQPAVDLESGQSRLRVRVALPAYLARHQGKNGCRSQKRETWRSPRGEDQSLRVQERRSRLDRRRPARGNVWPLSLNLGSYPNPSLPTIFSDNSRKTAG